MATGQHIVLELAVGLPKKTHVYAPGIQHYIPVDWTIADGAGYHVGPVEYPASTVMRLEVIHESVPVFQGHFRLLRAVTIGDPAELKPILEKGGALVIEGNFRYQACDDVECYLPETVLVKWTLHALPLDRTRVPESQQRKAPSP
ncbi:MAG: protein-disulfide reductase DsbD domain-containing protein [Bryobacteraceae bacterium]